jgi:hypothetical protein
LGIINDTAVDDSAVNDRAVNDRAGDLSFLSVHVMKVAHYGNIKDNVSAPGEIIKHPAGLGLNPILKQEAQGQHRSPESYWLIFRL